METAFYLAPIGLCVLDLDFRYVTVNACFAAMYGLDEGAFAGRTVYEALPGPAPQIVAHLQHAVEQKGAVDKEITLQNPAPDRDPDIADELTYLRTAQPLFDKGGNIVGISVALSDITQRKRSDLALRESEENLRYTVELTPHIPWTADADGKLTFISPRWQQVTGTRPEDFKAWALALHPDDRDATNALWGQSVHSGRPYDAEYRIRAENGDWRWFRARAYPRLDAQRRIVRWYGTVEDIHDEKVIGMELAEATLELARRSQEDHLTLLANRRRFDEVLAREIDRSRRTKRPLALILMDVDHFKSFNDLAGHLAGDECLQRVAQALNRAIRRPADIAARFGGEEFAIILPETDMAGALHIARRTLDEVRLLRFPYDDERLQRVTISAGLAMLQPIEGESTPGLMRALIAAADAALYVAKSSGRDCVAS